ncbi:MAG: hypothetical protein IPJ81_08365 [Chitinophagaceae bacterium]|nr:hypothetical protein [Chitinophagaceae bacterium]
MAKKRSPEISPTAQTAEFWEYNADIGRRWNVDPLTSKYPSISPYVFGLNNPIVMVDPDGRDAIVSITRNKDGSVMLKVQTVVHITGSTEPSRIKGYNKDVKERFKKSAGKCGRKSLEYPIRYSVCI